MIERSYGGHLGSMVHGEKHLTALTTGERKFTARLGQPAVKTGMNVHGAVAIAPDRRHPFGRTEYRKVMGQPHAFASSGQRAWLKASTDAL